MIKVEVANVPAYTREPQQLRQNYDFLPDGYGDLVILVESLNEIMADKLVSLVDCTAYVRYRDIWDLHWLRQQGATMNPDLLRRKLVDYRSVQYAANASALIEHLPAIIHGKEFRDQMSRFLPSEVQERTLMKDKFLDLLVNETKNTLEAAAQANAAADT